MHAIEKCTDVVAAIGEVATVSGVAAGPELRVFSVHVALDRAEVPDEIAQGESPRFVSPSHLLRGNAGDHALGAPADFFEVVEERVEIGWHDADLMRKTRECRRKLVERIPCCSLLTRSAVGPSTRAFALAQDDREREEAQRKPRPCL